MDTSRRDEEQESEPAEETPRPTPTPKPRRRGGTPMQPVERAVIEPPERR